MMTMISLNDLLEQQSTHFGTSFSIDVPRGENHAALIRFSSIAASQTFSLRVIRTWRTTGVVFEPDAFAGNLVTFLTQQTFEKRERISSLIQFFKSKSVRCDLRINGMDFQELYQTQNSPSLFSFEAEVLSQESSIGHLLLNDVEVNLVRCAISIFSALLIPETTICVSPDETIGYPEGAMERIEVNRYERDIRNRQLAIDIHGLTCLVCNFNFEKFYGSLGSRYIVIHHVVPVSELGSNYRVDPLTDLVPLCANCHAMIHASNPPLSLDELKQRIEASLNSD